MTLRIVSWVILSLACSAVGRADAPASRVFDVRAYGAAGGWQDARFGRDQPDHPAAPQLAVARCSFAGTYVSASIRLKSNITL